MKKLPLWIVFMLCVSGVSYARYTDLDDALKNGVSRGESVLYVNYDSYRRPSPLPRARKTRTISGIGLENRNIIGTVGLGYVSGFYYDIRAAISFLAMKRFYNFHRNGFYLYANYLAMLGQSFVEYFDGDTAIKAGRFLPHNPFVNNLVDGVWVRNGSFENVLFDLMWVTDYGRVSHYEITTFAHIKSGYFSGNAKYYFSRSRSDYKNSAYLSGYTLFVPDYFTAIGTRWHSALRFNNSSLWIGVDAGAGGIIEYIRDSQSYRKNTHLVDLKLGFGMSDFDVFLGYAGSGVNGLGGFNMLGIGNGPLLGYRISYHNIVPFFTWGGSAIRSMSNAGLFYGTVRMSFFSNNANLYLAYGVTLYKYLGRSTHQNEMNSMLDFSISNNVSMVLMFTGVSSIYTRFSGGVKLSF